ncbi:NACHT, LRR and PYD domains-containing protein 3 [Alligator mississippiensis]|nr:NACHT, LRR and PYD domains-containing protein 3 [Alligator mississippiensis]
MGNQSSRVSDLLFCALEDLSEKDFKEFKDKLLYSKFKVKGNISRSQLENADKIDTKNLLMRFYGEDTAVSVAIEALMKINRRDTAAKLRGEREKDLGLNKISLDLTENDYRVKYREYIFKEYQYIIDRNARLGETVTLNSRYTKLIMVNEHRHEKEREHEIMAMGQRHAEIMKKQAISSITIDSLFNPNKNGQVPETVVLVGAAGIGKTVTARKIMLDWAAGKLYQENFDYVSYINCRELNLLTNDKSVADIILKNYPINNAPIEHIFMHPEKLLFIIDGFDELRFNLDQPESDLCSDPWEKKAVEVILGSLFRRTVLRECYLIITTRPIALEKLRQHVKCAYYAEILGYSEEDREEYFYKFFGNDRQALHAFNFISENEVLFTMCFVPIMCWIICTVLKQQMERGEDLVQTSKTVTGVYILFLFCLKDSSSSNLKLQMQTQMRRLCSLAVDGIWEQKILFEEKDIKKHGLDQADFLPLFLNENIFQRDIGSVSAYSFIHLSFQEFFAALFYVLEEDEDTRKDSVTPKREVNTLLAYYGKSRHYLMLTVRFLFGLLNENRRKDIEEKLGYKMLPNLKTDVGTWISSFYPSANNQIEDLEALYCLYESQEEQLVKNALMHFTKLELRGKLLTPMDQQVLSFCVKSCPQMKSLLICHCGFRLESHEEKEFQGPSKQLCQEQGTQSPIYLLCQALKEPNCKLETLKLWSCNLTSSCFEDLNSVLRKNDSLRELDLGDNVPGDYGVQVLCEGVKQSKLERLGLWSCRLTGACCGDLSAVLSTKQSLIELELGHNDVGDFAVRRLCEGLKHPNCKLQRLRLWWCKFTGTCCGDLAAVLRSNRSLVELELGGNEHLGDAGVQQLCEGLKHPNCKLQKLGLNDCDLTAGCCRELSIVLSTSQTLTELDLRENQLGHSGVKLLCEGLKHLNCKLQKLRLSRHMVQKETKQELGAVKEIKAGLVIESNW